MGLGTVFKIRIRLSYKIALTLGTAATMIGRGLSEFLVGWIPIFGNVFDALTAIEVIELLGWIVVRLFKTSI